MNAFEIEKPRRITEDTESASPVSGEVNRISFDGPPIQGQAAKPAPKNVPVYSGGSSTSEPGDSIEAQVMPFSAPCVGRSDIARGIVDASK